MTTALAFLVLLQIFSGVRSTVQRTGPPLPAREKDCQLEFLDTKAERRREVVGVIQVWVRRNKITMGRQAVYEETVPEMRKQACKLGAEGLVVVQQTVSHSGEFKLLYVKAEAVCFSAKEPGKPTSVGDWLLFLSCAGAGPAIVLLIIQIHAWRSRRWLRRLFPMRTRSHTSVTKERI